MNPHDPTLDRIPDPDPIQEAMLDRRLAETNRELLAHRPPAALEGALVAQFRRTHQPARARPRLWWMPPLALAATLAVVSWMVRVPMPASGPQPLSATSSAMAPAQDPGPFLALKPLDRIAAEPSTTVVTTEFPRALLADWGLPVSPELAGQPVRAEMLYSAEGEALAVRLLN
jgi:hypothetical protein